MEISENISIKEVTFLAKIAILPYKVAQQYLAEMVDVLEYLHSKGIAHRDLKPENFLIDEKMHIKFSDFGSAKFCPVSQLSGNRREALVGTQNYVAPEILLTQESDRKSVV